MEESARLESRATYLHGGVCLAQGSRFVFADSVDHFIMHKLLAAGKVRRLAQHASQHVLENRIGVAGDCWQFRLPVCTCLMSHRMRRVPESI